MECIRSYGVIDIWPHTKRNGKILYCVYMCISFEANSTTLFKMPNNRIKVLIEFSTNFRGKSKALPAKGVVWLRKFISKWKHKGHISCERILCILHLRTIEKLWWIECRICFVTNINSARKWWFINFASKIYSTETITTFILMVFW